MEFNILIKTKDFVDEFAQFEIEDYFERDFKKISEGFFEIKFKKNEIDEMIIFILNLVKYSRVIENIYLKILEFDDSILIKKENKKENENSNGVIENIKNIKTEIMKKIDFLKTDLKFEIDSLKDFNLEHQLFEKIFGRIILDLKSNLVVDLDNFDISFKLFSNENKENKHYLVLDLISLNLLKRDYKINNGALTLNSILPNYLFYLLGIDEVKKNYSILDPVSSLGDIIIEAIYFNPRLALNLNKISKLPLKKIFNIGLLEYKKLIRKTEEIEKGKKEYIKNKVYSVVQNNKIFKEQRENLNYSGMNLKLSQYTCDWLDVKFKEAEIDFIVCQIPDFNEEKKLNDFLKEFFYQIEFIFNIGIGIISKKEIDKKYFKKNELNIEFENKVYIGKQQYFIYILN